MGVVAGLRQVGKKVAVTASTGVAAHNISPEATTLHRFCGLLDGRYTVKQLSQRIYHDEAWEKVCGEVAMTDTLAVDEASIISAAIFSQVECVYRLVWDPGRLFGPDNRSKTAATHGR